MARVWPCGLNATEEKASPWVLMSGAAMGWGVARSHNHTVPARPSLWAAAMVVAVRAERQRGEGAAGAVGGERCADRGVGGSLPQPDAAIVAAGGQGLAARAERHRVNAGVAVDEPPADRAVGGHLPQPDAAIVAAGGQGLAVRAERHRVKAGVAGGEPPADRAGGGGVPHTARA